MMMLMYVDDDVCSASCKWLSMIPCLTPENRMTLWEPHSRPLPQFSGLGCDQSTSGSFMPVSTDKYSMSLVQGMTLTRADPAESKMHLMMAHSSALKPANMIACRRHSRPMITSGRLQEAFLSHSSDADYVRGYDAASVHRVACMLCMLYSLVVDTGCIWMLTKRTNLWAPGSFIHVFIHQV